jgi:cytochrome o ubiquinol oxidase subunit 2
MPGIAILDPKGSVALAERALMLHAVEFMLIVIVPVFFLLFFFAWWYRAGNSRAKYVPDWEHAKMDELIWWAIPFEIVLILGALTWGSTHKLDPRVPLSAEPPLVIQVVALEWKWLFIYPEQHIATVNYVRLPAGKSVRFDITADAPMNSFWIPRLGGQIYAMTGMVTNLNLVADEAGSYPGGSANYSGVGFADMKFTAQATSQEDFNSWVSTVRNAQDTLTLSAYERLEQPSAAKVSYYADVQPDLFASVVAKFTDATKPAHIH